MTYYTHFYAECPISEIEYEVEVVFSCDEEESRESFWGFPVSVPASGAVEILEVFKDGVEWLDYPDSITNRLHDKEWEPCDYSIKRRYAHSISKTKQLVPCKKRLAA